MQGENERQWKKTKREHSSVSTEELFSLITEASSWIHYNYVPDCIYHAAQRMLPEIDDIRIPRRPWDERFHSMIARLKRRTFWQKHKQTLVSSGWIAAKR